MFKLDFKFLLPVVVLFFSTLGAASTIMLEKKLTPGFTSVPFQKFLTCRITKHQVYIERGIGSLRSQSVQAIRLDGHIDALIRKAGQGRIEIENAPTDLPTVSYKAYLDFGTEKGPVPLLSEGSEVYTNESQEAQQLVNFIDLHCPSF